MIIYDIKEFHNCKNSKNNINIELYLLIENHLCSIKKKSFQTNKLKIKSKRFNLD